MTRPVLDTEYLCISNTIPAFQYRLICHTSYIRISKRGRSRLAEQKQLSRAEVRRTIAASLATAFGLVIALVWSNVVLGGLKTFGVNLDVTPTLYGWLYFVVI